MRYLKHTMTVVLVMVALFASAQTSQKLAPQDFAKKMSEAKGPLVLDVRTDKEYKEGHLANAVNIDFYKDDFKSQLSKLDKKKPVFVYCAAGGRSGKTATTLSDLGFKEIYDLSGGMQAWMQAKKPVVK